MDFTFTIYGLFDPRDSKCFYVGRTSQAIGRRLVEHNRDAKKGSNSPRSKRIRQMLSEGGKPQIKELSRVVTSEEQEVVDAEQSWIDFMGITCELLNSAPASGGSVLSRSKIVITPGVIDSLKTKTSTEVAAQLGVTDSVVHSLRVKLGIPSKFAKKRIQWTTELASRLGVDLDTEIAESIGEHKRIVRAERVRRGIPPSRKGRKKTGIQDRLKQKFTQESLSMLGHVSDTEISKRLGIKRSSVSRMRQYLSIEPAKSVPSNKWIPDENAITLFGTKPDRDVALSLGVDLAQVAKARLRLGIKSFDEQNGYPSRRGNPSVGIKQAVDLDAASLLEVADSRLGIEPDRVIAKDLDVSPGVIARLRRKKGILPWKTGVKIA